MDIGEILGGLSRAISRRIDWELIRNVFEMTKTKRQGVRRTVAVVQFVRNKIRRVSRILRKEGLSLA